MFTCIPVQQFKRSFGRNNCCCVYVQIQCVIKSERRNGCEDETYFGIRYNSVKKKELKGQLLSDNDNFCEEA